MERRRQAAFVAIAAIQAIAAGFFVTDAGADLLAGNLTTHTVLETVIVAGLIFGTIFGLREFNLIRRRMVTQERALAAAAGALGEVIDNQFTAWGLTPAEREVALLALKGFENSEIAEMRGAASGTVRAQMTSVYSKAGVSGRPQFAAFFVEDLLVEGIPERSWRADLENAAN